MCWAWHRGLEVERAEGIVLGPGASEEAWQAWAARGLPGLLVAELLR